MSNEPFHISLRYCNSKDLKFKILPSTSVDDIKHEFSQRHGIDFSRITLYYNNKEIPDTTTAAEIELVDKAVLEAEISFVSSPPRQTILKFVSDFYAALNESPSNALLYFREASTCVHTELKPAASYQGLKSIKKHILSRQFLHAATAQYKEADVDMQRTPEGTLMVTLSGTWSHPHLLQPCCYLHSLILHSPEEDNTELYIHNSMFKLLAAVPVSPKELMLSTERLCDQPGCSTKGRFKCTVCRRVYYCSQNCQREHWRHHRHHCKSSIRSAFVISDVLLVLHSAGYVEEVNVCLGVCRALWSDVRLWRIMINHTPSGGWALGATRLHWQCYKGNLERVQQLLALGADVKLAKEDGRTATHLASQISKSAVLLALIDSGADANCRDCDGVTPLHLASVLGHVVIVCCLLKAGADVNAVNDAGVSALYLTCHYGHSELTRILLKAHADPSLRATESGVSPLCVACQQGHVNVVKELLQAGADVNITLYNGASALFIACQEGHVEVVEALLVAGANTSATNETGASAMYIASQEGHCSIVEALIENLASVHLKKKNGTTALSISCQQGHRAVVLALLRAGACVNDANEEGVNALFTAARHGHSDIVTDLLAAGADVRAVTRDGQSAIDVARENNHPKIATLLSRAGALDDCLPDYDSNDSNSTASTVTRFSSALSIS